MHKIVTTLLLLATFTCASAQKIMLGEARFKTGDNVEWKAPLFNDSEWPVIKTTTSWEQQGYNGYDGYAWYRFHFVVSSALKNKSALKDSLLVYFARIDDSDETYLNGVLIGKSGKNPDDAGGVITAAGNTRNYTAAIKNLIKWDADNVLAVRVHDIAIDGGISGDTPYFKLSDYIDGIRMQLGNTFIYGANGPTNSVRLSNKLKMPVSGTLAVHIKSQETGKLLSRAQKSVTILPKSDKLVTGMLPAREGLYYECVFTEKLTGKSISESGRLPYILTPPAPPAPRINGASVFGVRPNSPVLYKIPVSGKRPIRYGVQNLPAGLKVDTKTGIISGSLSQKGTYELSLTASNTAGKSTRGFVIKVGDTIGLTPAMGWNSWNCWGLTVNTERVKNSAQALISKGLADHGWNYVNIDDAWQSPKRANDGTIVPNERFPDMKGLGDWLHNNGLKFGIYSSPGRVTCGLYTGSLGHEVQDAVTYNSWGVDYLKYDWCSYSEVAGNDTSLAAFQKPYKVMQKGLLAQPRDIIYSLCQYGMKDVWKWGPEVSGNSWRTDNDIVDNWASLSQIIEKQANLYPYAGPGRFNDPDMLIVGKVGWSSTLRNSNLTADEQYLHISMWCLLSSPLLIGCDISQMDEFTLSLLTNDEVLAVNQDVLGKQAQRVINNKGAQVWMKELADGSKAIGIFNMTEEYKTIPVKWSDLNLPTNQKVRDLWRQKGLGSVNNTFTRKIAPHGVVLIKVMPD